MNRAFPVRQAPDAIRDLKPVGQRL